MFKEFDAGSWLAFIVVVLGISLAIFYWIVRWAFSVKRQLWNQQQQINLLLKIAEKLGVENDDQLKAIDEQNNNPKKYL